MTRVPAALVRNISNVVVDSFVRFKDRLVKSKTYLFRQYSIWLASTYGKYAKVRQKLS